MPPPPKLPDSKAMCICNLYWDANPIIVDIETDANIPSVQISCREAPQQKLSMISKNSCSIIFYFRRLGIRLGDINVYHKTNRGKYNMIIFHFDSTGNLNLGVILLHTFRCKDL